MAEQDNSILKLFGFELKRAEDKQKEEKKKKLQSVVTPTDPDGAGYVTASGSHYGPVSYTHLTLPTTPYV